MVSMCVKAVTRIFMGGSFEIISLSKWTFFEQR